MNYKNIIRQIKMHIPEKITIIAASKTRTVTEIQAAKNGGIQHFGENYVQEAESKKEAFKGATCHLIGKLQSNKAKQAAALFDVIHTVTSAKLANKLNEACEALNKTLQIFIQVNIGNEPQKNGVSVTELPELINHIHTLPHLHLLGLMIIPPAGEAPTPYFQQAQALTKQYGFNALSMGMSGDYQEAIKHGATHIRIGTALFGRRSPTFNQ